jgi:transcription elongation factor GreA
MSDQNPSLGEAAGLFLAGLPPEERGTAQREVYRFIRWFGRDRSFDGLNASEIANYAEQSSLSDTGYAQKLAVVRTFLSYARKKGWSKTNLAVHLKAKKVKAKTGPSSAKEPREIISLTREGYAGLEEELKELQDQRQEAIDEMRRAAADKDFRENAPLQAAREKRGMLEGRIIELEATLKSAVIIDEERKGTPGVNIGSRFILTDVDEGAEMYYILVGPGEADPAKGRISSASPIGKAVIGKKQDEIVEIAAPAGKRCFKLKQIEN